MIYISTLNITLIHIVVIIVDFMIDLQKPYDYLITHFITRLVLFDGPIMNLQTHLPLTSVERKQWVQSQQHSYIKACLNICNKQQQQQAKHLQQQLQINTIKPYQISATLPRCIPSGLINIFRSQ
eukprot:UN08372